MNNKDSTTEQLNKLIEFRQNVYEHLTDYGDAQFELIDGLLSDSRVNSFVELTLSPVFQRGWGSAYAAIEKGSLDEVGLQAQYCQLLPDGQTRVYALDTTVWSHPSARTLSELMYEYSPIKGIPKHRVVKSHSYSLLSWSAQRGSSWALPVQVQRVKAGQTAIEVGGEQVKGHCRMCQVHGLSGQTVITVDGKYGTHRFLGPLRDEPCLVVARLRRDRVLYGPPPPYAGFGRPRQHGQRFVFKEAETWPEPDEVHVFRDERWGQVRLRGWHHLHAKQDAATPFTAIYAEVRCERQHPPAPIWLAFLNHNQAQQSIKQAWLWFDHRWSIEPSIRFRKQRLHWLLPCFLQSERCDQWSQLVDVAYWQLFLARDLVRQHPLPWQKHLAQLSPGRILQNFALLFAQIGSPTRPVQPRGKSPGWPTGKPRTRPKRYQPIIRNPKHAQMA